MDELKPEHFKVEKLGEALYDSPVKVNGYVPEEERFLYHINPEIVLAQHEKGEPICTLERSGPREKIYFDHKNTKAAIVTCGGLCPGLNNVIRAISLELLFQYKIKSVIGYRFGFRGVADSSIEPMILNTQSLAGASDRGGSILASSRGPQEVGVMVDRLVKDQVDIFFVIGGDGSLRGAQAIHEEIKKRGLKISVIGIPKTIDNDLNFISKSFGFHTAYSKAVEAITCVHTESLGAPNGIGIVKVMGRHSGAIACNATISSHEVNFCLIPEAGFQLEGKGGLLEALEERLKTRGHAVIVIAEGVMQDKIGDSSKKDASGNVKLADVGLWLKGKLDEHLTKIGLEHTIKYIDPSYIIRSVPASPEDALFCTILGQYAVHAAMSGRTALVIGQWNHFFANIPIELVTHERKIVNTKGTIWRAVMESTGQNQSMEFTYES